MSDVLVKDIEMPNVCAYCFLDTSECDLHLKVNIWRERHPDCPLIGLPPHGRLIAEKTITEIRYHDADGYHIVNGEQLCELEIDAETVIEGSET